MKSPQRILALAALTAACVVSLQAHADECRLPPAPSKIPDGSTASQQEMVTAMETIKQYNSDVQTYLKCLDFEARQNQLSPGDETSLHNSAVDQLTRVADQFNEQVKTFKSKHG
jgi:predicted transglutaminase-like cysteine proteinase